MTTDAILGPLTGTTDIEQAYLRSLRAWLPTMLFVVERRKGLRPKTLPRPPAPESYTGGLDFETYHEDLCPMVTVIVNPTGTTERNTAGYGQWFEVQVGATVIGQTEDETRLAAGYVGLAVAAAVNQDPSLGGLASSTELASSPGVEFVDPTIRRLALARITYMTFVDGLIDPIAGTGVPTPPDSPHYGGTPSAPFTDPPTVTAPIVRLNAEPA